MSDRPTSTRRPGTRPPRRNRKRSAAAEHHPRPTGDDSPRASRRARRARRRLPGQGSFDDLGTPLIDVTFCVIDLETTGGSPVDDEICEIGAVKVRGGECLGTFHTFVDPGRDLPPFITHLTGLTSAMVRPAPTISAVLPSLLEFLGDAVFVGHNVRFDHDFVTAALGRTGRDEIDNLVVDTCTLARRLVRDEVPNCKLGTLAERLRLDHRPTHRALDDALATADLLHLLLERAAGFGVATLDDLLDLPSAASHPQAAKLALTDDLPRAPGAYLFRDAGGRVLYVGKATNVRSRVRSYFSTDTRRKVGGLLRETAAIDHVETASALEAAVTEIRLIHQHLPRYNRQGTSFPRSAYLKLTDEAFPRLSVVKRAPVDAVHLGPLPSTRVAKRVAEAIQHTVPVRRCTEDPRRAPRDTPCTPAQLGVAACPCACPDDAARYPTIAARTAGALGDEPLDVADALESRLRTLAAEQRFEEAADVRDRLLAFCDAHRRVRRMRQVCEAGRLVVSDGSRRYVIERGRLAHAEPADQPSLLSSSEMGAAPGRSHESPVARADPATSVIAPEAADELLVLASWLDTRAPSLRVEACDGVLASPLPRLPDPRR